MAARVMVAHRGVHFTLSGSTADSVTFPNAPSAPGERYEIVNTGSTAIYIRTDGTTATAQAGGTTVIPAGGWIEFAAASNTTLSVVASAGGSYSIDYAEPQ